MSGVVDVIAALLAVLVFALYIALRLRDARLWADLLDAVDRIEALLVDVYEQKNGDDDLEPPAR